MKKAILAIALFSVTASMANAAGSNGTISFGGTIRDTACSIADTDLNQRISFGDVAKSLINGGGRSAPQTVQIKLKSCDAATLTTIKTTLDGAPAGFSDAFGVSGVSNAGILIEQGGRAITPGTSVTQPLRDGENTVVFQASVIGNSAAGANVTEGEFESTVNFFVDYS
jgi:major pilin subunit PapA